MPDDEMSGDSQFETYKETLTFICSLEPGNHNLWLAIRFKKKGS